VKQHSSYNAHILGVIKDCFIIIILFVSFYFIDIQLAAFIALICTSLLLSGWIILDYNPGFIKGHHIAYHEKELIVPKGVDVFDLSKVPTMEYLQRYTEVIRGILFPPAVLIIRFTGILWIEEFDLYILTEVIGRLQKSDIAVIFSDVGKDIQYQLRQFGIENNLESENVCYNVNDALTQANKALKKTRRNNCN
jgi:hypothetical protein